MHFHAEVWIEEYLPIDSVELENKIEEIMAPYYEGAYEEEDFEGETPPLTLWDWYSIGGRWTGVHDNYDVTTNPNNSKVCYICGGKGDREDWVWYDIDNVRRFKDDWAKTCNGCNACNGTGRKLKHASEMEKHKEDIISVQDIPDKFNCYTLIVNGNVYETDKDSFVGMFNKQANTFDSNVKNKLNELGIDYGYLVTIDYHC